MLDDSRVIFGLGLIGFGGVLLIMRRDSLVDAFAIGSIITGLINIWKGYSNSGQ
jgi:hypothetical protein